MSAPRAGSKGASKSSAKSVTVRMWYADAIRLRQTDVKAGHFERKVQALESARDQWESKYEEMAKKYADTKKELDEFVSEIGNI